MLLNNRTKINITFILPSLAAGGAERVVSFVAQHIDKSIFNPTLLICGYQSQTEYSIKNINIIYLNKSRVLAAIPQLLKYAINKRSDIIMSAIGHLNTIMAYASFLAPKTKFVAREVNILSVLKNYELKKNSIGSVFSRNRFRYFDSIICQSIDMKNDLKSNFKLNSDNLVVINNPITDKFKLVNYTRKTSGVIKFITVARLKEQKGHKRIIEALSKVEFPFQYTIIGDGPEYENLFNQIKQHQMQSKVVHVKSTKEVHNYLSENDIYLQGSYIEGFPNAVIESSAVGTPILAFDAPGGINEIIEDSINGFRVGSEIEFIEKLNSIYQNYTFVPEKVSASVTKKYSKEIIIKQYEDLFLNLFQSLKN